MDGSAAPQVPRRVAVVGTPRGAGAALDLLRGSPTEVVGVVARPDEVGRVPGLAPLLSRARESAIPVLSPRGASVAAALRWLTHLALDFVVTVGWSELLTEELFLVPRHGVVGLEAEPPLAVRPRVAPDWAVLRAGTLTGHVLLVLLPSAAAALSGSPRRRHTDSGHDADGDDPYGVLAALGDRLLRTERAEALVGGAADGPSAPARLRVSVPLGLTSFDRPAPEVHRWVQAMGATGRGAFAVLRGEPLLIWDCEPAGGSGRSLPPGTVLGSDTGVVVSTLGGAVRLLRVQEPGRHTEPATEWFERLTLPPGCAFEPVDWSELAWLRT